MNINIEWLMFMVRLMALGRGNDGPTSGSQEPKHLFDRANGCHVRLRLGKG
jgi:hypothetical protein